MPELDKETAELAFEAFVAEDEKTSSQETSSVDSWASEVSSLDEPKPAAPPEPPEDPETEKAETAHLMSREDAKLLTCPDYDTFDDILDANGHINLDRLGEYTAEIPFSYVSPVTGKNKTKFLAKYPRFLALFPGKTRISEVSLAMVAQKFNPEGFKKDMEEDMDRSRVSEAAAEIMSRPDFTLDGQLKGSDYEILRKCGVTGIDRFNTGRELVEFISTGGIGIEAIGDIGMEFDSGNGLQYNYNDDYGEAMKEGGMEVVDMGETEPFDGETVSVDELMGFIPSAMRNSRLWKPVFGKGSDKEE